MQTEPTKITTAPWSAMLEQIGWVGASTWGRLPPVARLRGGVGAGRVLHGEWGALLERFVVEGQVDYTTLARVQRLVETYLEGLADSDPDTFADADDQLAFFINAYNALALYQVVRHYPVVSIQDVPYAFLRSFPVGRRNVSLIQLHGTLIRAYGDPRVHAALCPAARGAASLPSEPFLGTTLQSQLDQALRQFLTDPDRGARYDAATNTLLLAAPLARWRGDFVFPHRMPRVLPWTGLVRQQRLVRALLPYLPPFIAHIATQTQPRVRALPFDWGLNDQAS